MTDYETLRDVMTRLYERDREAYHVITNLFFWKAVGKEYAIEKMRAKHNNDEKGYQARIQELLARNDCSKCGVALKQENE
jgi:hypothetical protein